MKASLKRALAGLVLVGASAVGYNSVVLAGDVTTHVVIEVVNSIIPLGDEVEIDVAVQGNTPGSCSVNGIVTVSIDGNPLDPAAVTDPGMVGNVAVAFTVASSSLGSLGMYEVTAEFTSSSGINDCISASAGTPGEFEIVEPATTTTEELIVDSTMPGSVNSASELANTGSGVSNAWLLAAVAAVIAGFGAVIARRRA